VDKDKLQEILVKHEQWLNDDEGGERANLREANLRGADLQWANLRVADLQWANLRVANLRGANLRWANLRGADLRGADLRGADLRGADLDFSVWPLWCGSNGVKADNKILYQLIAHICVLDCDTPEFKEIREFLLPYAKQSHRAVDLGLGELNER
jgi:hypothetical protein